MRDCDKADRLVELNLYVNVLNNTVPFPVDTIKTSFSLQVGDVLVYKIPKLIDSEANDIPECLVLPTQSKED